jgi:hypothetical protein
MALVTPIKARIGTKAIVADAGVKRSVVNQ